MSGILAFVPFRTKELFWKLTLSEAFKKELTFSDNLPRRKGNFYWVSEAEENDLESQMQEGTLNKGIDK